MLFLVFVELLDHRIVISAVLLEVVEFSLQHINVLSDGRFEFLQPLVLLIIIILQPFLLLQLVVKKLQLQLQVGERQLLFLLLTLFILILGQIGGALVEAQVRLVHRNVALHGGSSPFVGPGAEHQPL